MIELDWLRQKKREKRKNLKWTDMEKKLEFIKISRNREIFKHFQPKNPHNLNF